jgi:hypothetical protein
MRLLHTSVCFVTLSLLLSIGSASAFPSLKKSKQPAASTAPAAAKADTKDVGASLDDYLKAPVDPGHLKPAQTDPLPQQQPQPVPEPQQLRGTVDESAMKEKLQGGVNASETKTLLEGSAQKEDTTVILKGGASKTGAGLSAEEDPDMNDRELQVEWDRWRNKFLRAVQLQVQAGVNHPDDWEEDARPRVTYDPYSGTAVIQPRFPMGTEAWFACEVTADKRIKNLSIIRPSAHPGYDRAVLEGVRALEGTSLLTFPSCSKRATVRQAAGIRTSTSSDYNYHHFGDVERVRQPQ